MKFAWDDLTTTERKFGRGLKGIKRNEQRPTEVIISVEEMDIFTFAGELISYLNDLTHVGQDKEITIVRSM